MQADRRCPIQWIFLAPCLLARAAAKVVAWQKLKCQTPWQASSQDLAWALDVHREQPTMDIHQTLWRCCLGFSVHARDQAKALALRPLDPCLPQQLRQRPIVKKLQATVMRMQAEL